MSETIIKFEGVSFVYGENTPAPKIALDNIDLEIKKGIITGIIGHTGSGKSTLLQLMNGIIKPTSGNVYLNGKNIWEEPKKIRDVRFKVGLVFQYPEYQLFEETVYKDISFGPRNMGLDENEIDLRIKESMRFTGLPESYIEKSPFDLSGGEKRRVAIAGVIAMNPDVLVLDEPAAGLDPIGRKEIFGGISEFKKNVEDSTVIIVSHSMEDIAKYCDEIVVLNDSHLLMQGSPVEIFSKSDEIISCGLSIPEISKVILELRSRGIDLPMNIHTVDEAVSAINDILKGDSNAF